MNENRIRKMKGENDEGIIDIQVIIGHALLRNIHKFGTRYTRNSRVEQAIGEVDNAMVIILIIPGKGK